MKIRTDFVTNSSSSSFTLIINITMKDGNVFSWNGVASSGEGDDDYYELYASKSPKELASVKSIYELIKMLDESLTDGCPGDEYCKSLGIGKGFKDDGLETYNMDDLSTIEITGNEKNYICYNRTFIYDVKKNKYTSKIEGCDFEKNGVSGGNLLFKVNLPLDYDKEIKEYFPNEINVWPEQNNKRITDSLNKGDLIILDYKKLSPSYWKLKVCSQNGDLIREIENYETSDFDKVLIKLIEDKKYKAYIKELTKYSELKDKRKSPELIVTIEAIDI